MCYSIIQLLTDFNPKANKDAYELRAVDYS